jgi:hypothetical protein
MKTHREISIRKLSEMAEAGIRERSLLSQMELETEEKKRQLGQREMDVKLASLHAGKRPAQSLSQMRQAGACPSKVSRADFQVSQRNAHGLSQLPLLRGLLGRLLPERPLPRTSEGRRPFRGTREARRSLSNCRFFKVDRCDTPRAERLMPAFDSTSRELTDGNRGHTTKGRTQGGPSGAEANRRAPNSLGTCGAQFVSKPAPNSLCLRPLAGGTHPEAGR